MSNPRYERPEFDPPPPENPNDTGRWSNKGLTLHRTLHHKGISMMKCTGCTNGFGRVFGDHVIYPLAATTTAQIESSVQTQMIELWPNDAYKKKQIVDEWTKVPKTKNGKTREEGWGNNIVPFASHLCLKRKGERNGGIFNSFVLHSILDEKSFVFINQINCEVGGLKDKRKTRVAFRPISIGTFTMRRDPEEHEEGTNRDLMEKIQSDFKKKIPDFAFDYEDGKTLVVEIKLVCGHNDFKGGGSEMIRKIVEFAAMHCEKTETSFICALDATMNKATCDFYIGMGFVSVSTIDVEDRRADGSVKSMETLRRFIRVVKLNPASPGTLLP